MTLLLRTALGVPAACTVAVVVLCFTLQGMLAARFTTLERRKADHDVGRASNALSQEIAGVEMTVGDWASRDEIYRSVQDGNAEYIASNLEAATFVNLDINLRGKMDGIEATKRIRERFGIPVIYLTAYDDEETRQRAGATDPVAYLVKIFGDVDLQSAIDKALRREKDQPPS